MQRGHRDPGHIFYWAFLSFVPRTQEFISIRKRHNFLNNRFCYGANSAKNEAKKVGKGIAVAKLNYFLLEEVDKQHFLIGTVHLAVYLVSSLSHQILKHVECLELPLHFNIKKTVDQRSSTCQLLHFYFLFIYYCYLF